MQLSDLQSILSSILSCVFASPVSDVTSEDGDLKFVATHISFPPSGNGNTVQGTCM